MPQRNIKQQKKKRREKEQEGFIQDGRTRVPRPKGFTLAIQNLNPNNPDKTKKTLNYLRRLIIEQWTMNNHELHGRQYSIKELSTFLNLPISITMKVMQEYLVRMADFFAGKDGERMGQIARAEIFRALFSGSESRSLLSKQTEILLASQGDSYKPFISGEVNRSLANLISADKVHLDLIKLMMPANTGHNLTINNLNNQTDKKVNYISTDQAVVMIRETAQSMIENPNMLPELTDVPNINARTQDLSKIGIKNPNLLPAPKEPRPSTESQFEHGNRPEIEE